MNQILDLDNERVIDVGSIQIPNPHYFFDTLKDKEVEPDIKIKEDINLLKDLDMVLYAKPISKNEAWAKRQKFVICLRPSEAPTEEDFKVLTKLPANHYFEVDVANFKIRVTGPFVSRNNVGPWLFY